MIEIIKNCTYKDDDHGLHDTIIYGIEEVFQNQVRSFNITLYFNHKNVSFQINSIRHFQGASIGSIQILFST